jgi:hypothetical protein
MWMYANTMRLIHGRRGPEGDNRPAKWIMDPRALARGPLFIQGRLSPSGPTLTCINVFNTLGRSYSSIFKKEKKTTTTNRNLLWSSLVEILVFCTEMFTVCVFKEASFIFIFFSDWICRIIFSNFNSNKNVFVLNTMCCQPTFTFTVNCFMT